MRRANDRVAPIGGRGERCRNAKVCQSRSTITSDKNIVWLDIAMQNQLLVETLQRAQNAKGNINNVCIGKSTFAYIAINQGNIRWSPSSAYGCCLRARKMSVNEPKSHNSKTN